MLTSKDVLERTGISRATLNNYISAGLLPRPQILPPNADDGAAPRIGYFPDSTLERIGEIQRLKREGWSISRIAGHLSGGAASLPPARTAQRAAPAVQSPALVAGPVGVGSAEEAKPAPSASLPVPMLTPVALLATELQDAGKLWLQLPAREYFELVSEIWTELDIVFRRHSGRHARHPGEGMVCHFVPQRNAGYLWDAVAAACDAREAMRQVSGRWQARKSWNLDLFMNTGVAEGQEWIGSLRPGEPTELTVLGAAADHAVQLSRLARAGGIWLTRDLVGKLADQDRGRLSYGVPRPGAEGRLVSTFTRLDELAARAQAGPVQPALAGLPVTELIALAAEPARPESRRAGNGA